MTEDATSPTVACTLDAARERERAQSAVRETLQKRYDGTDEHEDGFTFRFEGVGETYESVTTFVANERACCSFATFRVTIEPPYEETQLTVRGPEGTKALFEDLRQRLESAE